MTTQETAKLLATLKAAYPASYRNISPEDAKATVRLWSIIFSDIPYEAVSTAVLYHISTAGGAFAPAPGEIRNLLDRLKHPNEETPSEAWASVRKAMKNGCYGSEEEFAKLSPAAQMAVGSAGRLREMAIDENFNAGVEESHFLRAYTNCKDRLREAERIPDLLKPVLKKLADTMKLESVDSKVGAIAPARKEEFIS